LDDTIISSKADRGNASSRDDSHGEATENYTTTVLSSVSALTEEQECCEPWKDY
jgi:hypothetical protein